MFKILFKKNLYTGILHLSNEPKIEKYDFSKFIFQNINKENKRYKYKDYIKPIKSKNFKNIAKRPLNTSFNLSKIKKTKLIKNFNWKKKVKDLLKERLMSNISCIITVCDRNNYINDAITSVINQTKKPKEIIIIDNGFKKTNISQKFSNLIKIYNILPYAGIAQALNFGVSLSNLIT